MPPDKLDRIKKILAVLEGENSYARASDVAAIIRWLQKSLAQIQEAITAQFDAFEAKIDKKVADVKKVAEQLRVDVERKVGDAKRSLAYDKRRIDDDIQGIRDDVTQRPTHNEVAAMISAEPTIDLDTPESLVSKLESITDEEGKLSIDAIGHLKEILADLERLAKRSGSSSIAYSRGQIKLYDLSSLLDGVKTTFPLPAFWRVINVMSTSTPNAFRPTVDYTVDGAAMTITFTSQIDPSTTLASGQTLLVEYAEP